MIRTARLKAFAKLNLGLRVLYKRSDGYHELRTVFQTISLADRLDVEFSPARSTRVRLEGTPQILDNLVEKAAWLVLEELKIHADIGFNLMKNIPSGAGLGGGSSDAAAVLLCLPVLAGKRIHPERLAELASSLGSDVPFFLHGGAALGLGRGEELYPLPDRKARHVLLVAPDVHSSTAEAYAGLSARLTSDSLQNKLSSFQHEVWGGHHVSSEGLGVSNDFEEVVFLQHREVARIKTQLLAMRAVAAAMTGSGSAVFGIFDTRENLDRARESFAGSSPQERTGRGGRRQVVRERAFSRPQKSFAVSFVSRAQYRTNWLRALKNHVKGDQWPPHSLYAQ